MIRSPAIGRRSRNSEITRGSSTAATEGSVATATTPDSPSR